MLHEYVSNRITSSKKTHFFIIINDNVKKTVIQLNFSLEVSKKKNLKEKISGASHSETAFKYLLFT